MTAKGILEINLLFWFFLKFILINTNLKFDIKSNILYYHTII